MTYSQFRRWLAARDVQFVEGTKHTKLYFNGKQTTLPRHGSREISEGLRRAILKQLELKE